MSTSQPALYILDIASVVKVASCLKLGFKYLVKVQVV